MNVNTVLKVVVPVGTGIIAAVGAVIDEQKQKQQIKDMAEQNAKIVIDQLQKGQK